MCDQIAVSIDTLYYYCK